MQPDARSARPTRNEGSHVNSLDDERAVELVLAGDASAFSAIVQRWQGPLVNLAYRFCRDRARAEDLAQEAFVRAFRNLAMWRREAAFSTWLFALATNLCRSEIRRIPPAPLQVQEVAELIDPRRVDDDAETEDRDRVVRRALQSLPEKYRDALLLFYFHDMDVAQAARSLSLPEGTVKARLSRGRDILGRKLAAMLATAKTGDGNETR
jgi:RNA polymerase sigma-70 factor (ECF subfamily)